MAEMTIGILYPGMMGASLAWTLHHRLPHLTLLTSLSTRSQATKDRASSVGLKDVTLQQLVSKSDIIISILPPSEAITLAEQVTSTLASTPARSKQPIYIDANAIAPSSASKVGEILKKSKIPFIDANVIGGPAKEGYDPKLYFSSAPEYEKELELAVETLSGGGPGKGMKIVMMKGAGEGAASALKMAYGGIAKGTTGLANIMILAANAHSPETAQALVQEIADSRPGALAGFVNSIPGSIPKAYRFVGEMEENGRFIRDSLARLPDVSKDDGEVAARTYEGLAAVFQRIADDIRIAGEGGSSARGAEIDVLKDWSAMGKKILDEKETKK